MTERSRHALAPLLVALAVLVGTLGDADPVRAAPPPAVPVAAWALIDEADGAVLGERNGNERRPMASITKLMTARVVTDGAGDGTVVVPPAAVAIGGSSGGLVAGERVGTERLLALALIASGNDAAFTLAMGEAGSEAAFVRRMNALAQRLGLMDTRYVNAHGLDGEGHFSTALDSARLGMEIRRDPLLRRLVGERAVTTPAGVLPNTNLLLGTYPGADGVKTGMTSGAGWCLVASAAQDGRRLTVAVLGASSEEDRLQAAQSLLDWGFAEFRTVELFTDGQTIARVPTSAGAPLDLRPATDVTVTLRGAERPLVRVVAPERVDGPIAAGTALGRAEVVIGSRVSTTVPLVAAVAIETPESRWRILRLASRLTSP